MRVMVAEDDAALSLFLRKALEMEGHAVRCVSDGLLALEAIREYGPGILILDLGLPGLDGVDLLRSLNADGQRIPTMILTGRSDVALRIECLDTGADDFLQKPFSLYELLARCRALIRRAHGSDAGVLRQGDLRMDRIMRAVTYGGTTLDFTAKEFTLLEYLLQQSGRAVSRRELLDRVWHMSPEAGTNVVDVYVNYLRRKLGAAGAEDFVQTVRGEGYGVAVRKPAGRESAMPMLQLQGGKLGAA